MRQIMFELTVTSVDMLAAGIFALPGICVLALVCAKLRQRPLTAGTLAWLAAFALYLCAVFSVVGLPALQYIRFDPSCNLIPFIGMVENRTAMLLTVLNVALFVPLGWLAPVLWPKYADWRQMAGLGLGVSLLIEVIQIFSFRLTDVDDLIANTAGALLGLALYRLLPESWRQRLEREQPAPVWLAVAWAVIVMIVLQPLIYSRFWNLIMGV